MKNARLSKLRTHEQVLAKDLRDPGIRDEWNRSEFARAVAMRVVAYRAEHNLSQSSWLSDLA